MAIREEFPRLAAAQFDEVVTHSHVRDIALASGRSIALVTLDNGRDHTRPSTLGPETLFELGDTLEAQRERAAQGEIDAIAVTGKPYFLAAGVDLSNVADIPDRATAAELPVLELFQQSILLAIYFSPVKYPAEVMHCIWLPYLLFTVFRAGDEGWEKEAPGYSRGKSSILLMLTSSPSSDGNKDSGVGILQEVLVLRSTGVLHR